MLTTTLKEIRSHGPCDNGWSKLLDYLGKTRTEAKTDESPLPILTVLESNGMDDALWVVGHCVNGRICRLFAADCAERVLHFFEERFPNDNRPRQAIDIARNPDATDKERDAAARAAGAAGAAAGAATWAAARAAQRAAAGAAARDAQRARLIQYLEHGEAAKDMPWAKS